MSDLIPQDPLWLPTVLYYVKMKGIHLVTPVVKSPLKHSKLL